MIESRNAVGLQLGHKLGSRRVALLVDGYATAKRGTLRKEVRDPAHNDARHKAVTEAAAQFLEPGTGSGIWH